MRTPLPLFVLIASLGTGAIASGSAGPTFWTVASAADFLRGTSEGVSVSSQGILTMGPHLASRLTATQPQVWSLAEAADGTLWAGTGGDGRVLRIRPGQPQEIVFDSDETNIFAVAVSGSRVYAASSPDGRVYVIDGTAPAKPFFDPEEKYIWALAVDATGRLWVGAGNPAVIYRVDAGGTGRVMYRPPANHAVVLTPDAEGRMLAGTESPGRLYRFGPDDRPFAVLDSGLTEVRAVAVTADGVVYAAALNRGDDAGSPASDAPSAAVALATLPVSPTPTPTPTSTTRRSQLYRIDTSGAWETVWETSDLIYDLSAAEDGGVFVGTGPEGRLFRVDRARDVVLVTGVDAKHITRFAATPRTSARPMAIATANPGRVLTSAGAGQAPAGADQTAPTFLSPVRDSRSIATWGLIRWEATGSVGVFTRTGNTERPDDSWSDWAGPYANPQGDTIKSPPARFVQWKAVFARAAIQPATTLTSVTVAYLPKNGRPLVSAITVHPPGVVFQRPFSSEEGAIAGLDDATADARRPAGDPAAPPPSPGRRMFQKGLQTIGWKADDPDGDRLTYTLQYRREGETVWRDLRGGLLDALFVWDTTSVADGRYLVRVVATDAATNAADRVLAGERESGPIEIDNTPPQTTVDVTRQGTAARLLVRVRDNQSPVQKLEFSVGGGPWQLVYPADGLADSPDERYEIALPAGTDPARVVIRATDLLQNVSSVAVGAR